MKILVIELWGLGDAALVTTLLRPLLASGVSVTVFCKAATVELLRPSYPGLDFIVLDAPWTAFRGKYRLWKWPWKNLIRAVWSCRQRGFGAAVSVRNDPRDHLLMFLSGAPLRLGFPRLGSGLCLTASLPAPSAKAHRVDLWRQLGAALFELISLKDSLPPGSPDITMARPFLDADAYARSRRVLAPGENRPIIGLHCGARIAVRRWKEEFFQRTLLLLRKEEIFHLALFPDLDGYGRSLLPLADSTHEALSIPQLAADLAACDLVICNDSGPGHIAAALGRPVLAIFGPTQPDWYRPYGENNQVVARDICPFRPCFDYCRFPEPICLTTLTADEVWPEIRDWVRRQLENLRTLPVI